MNLKNPQAMEATNRNTVTTLELIKFLVNNPQREIVVIKDNDDMNTNEAINYLIDNCDPYDNWQTELENHSTILVY